MIPLIIQRTIGYAMQRFLGLMPARQLNWARAMKSEYEALEPGDQRTMFAMGCIKAAMIEVFKTRQALSYLGRTAMAASLVMMSTYGLILISNIEQSSAKTLLNALFIAYAGTGLIALYSLRALKIISSIGLALAFAAWVWNVFSAGSVFNIPTEFLAALSMEAGMLMLGIFFAAFYLSLIYSPEHDELLND